MPSALESFIPNEAGAPTYEGLAPLSIISFLVTSYLSVKLSNLSSRLNQTVSVVFRRLSSLLRRMSPPPPMPCSHLCLWPGEIPNDIHPRNASSGSSIWSVFSSGARTRHLCHPRPQRHVERAACKHYDLYLTPVPTTTGQPGRCHCILGLRCCRGFRQRIRQSLP